MKEMNHPPSAAERAARLAELERLHSEGQYHVAPECIAVKIIEKNILHRSDQQKQEPDAEEPSPRTTTVTKLCLLR